MLDTKVVMGCGHVSTAIYTAEDGEKVRVCPSCLQTNPKKAKEQLSLKDRIARCRECSRIAASDTALFDFQYNLKGETDSFYDGCRG